MTDYDSIISTQKRIDTSKLNEKIKIEMNGESRLKTLEVLNTQDFCIDLSNINTNNANNANNANNTNKPIKNQLGLFSNNNFSDIGILMGVYRGEMVQKKDFLDAKRSKEKYDKFLKKYRNKVNTNLARKDTLQKIEKLGFFIDDNRVLIMPEYPVTVDFYRKYNPMLFVNEPPPDKTANLTAYYNKQFDTVDYVNIVPIEVGDELYVSYGEFYRRNYDVGC